MFFVLLVTSVRQGKHCESSVRIRTSNLEPTDSALRCPSWRLRIFSLSLASGKTKKIVLYFFTEFKAYIFLILFNYFLFIE